MNDLILDLSQFLVERSTLVTHVLPTSSSSSNAGSGGGAGGAHDLSRHVLGHLLTIMVDYIRKARRSGDPKDEGEWTNDQVEVKWASGDWARLNITVVHAIIILLTYGPPNGAGGREGAAAAAAAALLQDGLTEGEEEDDAAFNELLEIWFPIDGKLPKAYLVGTRDEALLIYDWIKLRMLRSEVDRLVNVALVDLEASQLIIFVQSFGIPVKCMTRLLKALDKECRSNPESLEIQDKIYLIQVLRGNIW